MAPNRSSSMNAIALLLLILVFPSLAFSQDAATESLASFQTLYRFRGGADGIGPNGVVLDKAGNLHGTTVAGGETSCPLNGSPGCGVVFRVNGAGKETVQYRFSGDDPDQGGPFGSVILDAASNLYGTTSGLPLFAGTVFTVEKAGRQTVLHSFTGGADGGTPEAGLIQDAAGNLYGTTVFGGAFGQGVVFKLDTVLNLSVLHNFKGRGDGTNPLASLIRDTAGNLYGTASGGGSFKGPCAGSGCGTVFKLAPNGTLKVLHTFTGGSDGASPLALVRDLAGNLFGTASGGGDRDCTVGGSPGCGLVFRLDSKGNLTVLHTFTGGADGGSPNTGLALDAAGNLYGTTADGGTSRKGVVFKLDTAGKLIVLHAFTGGSDGGNPNSVVLDGAGNLYGTATSGGRCKDRGCGVVFKMTLKITELHTRF
jgi:uncharacterized repeat protein (TIGR03803 family)